ncbi:MAG: hypothetical protein LUD72_04850 [Bacteroidales bacterium]|nr:hypothetical protein [Bacteroidales bacterium]
MSNILTHNREIVQLHLTKRDYWDFHLSKDYNGYVPAEGVSDRCLVAYIDTNNPECVETDKLVSDNVYEWEDAVNEGVTLKHIGYTGIDNGLITYDKEKISNKEFLDIFFNSEYTVDKDDKRLVLYPVSGNNKIYDYANDIVMEGDIQVARLNGGFYQGCFEYYGNDYQVLPDTIEDGWTIEVVLKKSDLTNENTTLNDIHPDNKGIFLYIGTRAETKWWIKYNVDTEFDKAETGYFDTDYSDDGYSHADDQLNTQYLVDEEEAQTEDCGGYFKDKYNGDDYNGGDCDGCNHYVEDGYIEEDVTIDPDMDIKAESGFSLYQPNVGEITTDNKFLLFDHTKEGFNIHNWEEGTEVTLYSLKANTLDNYFLLFNRTCKGHTIHNMDDLISAETMDYDVLDDLYRNALAFQIRDDGSVGYKYLVKDCDNGGYKILSGFSKEGVISEDEWHTIAVKIVPEAKQFNIMSGICSKASKSESMKIYIYVDGKLVYGSEKMPMLNLKALNETSDKQESVPYNISLGGGTQGLCDVIYLNYRQLPEYVLPLEKEFGGTFVGYVKEMRFHTCPLTLNEIRENFETDAKLVR